MTAIDTSVAIAGIVEWHELHEVCARASRQASIPSHALLECYSVLTRLPPPHRLDAVVVGDLLARRFGRDRILTQSLGMQRSLVDELYRSDVSGGAVYDALVGLTANAHGERLLTCDARALPTYERLGIDIEVVSQSD